MKKGLVLLCLAISLMGCEQLSQILGPDKEPVPGGDGPPSGLTVSFDSRGGSPVAPASSVPPGTLIDPPTPPTKPGFAFAGWFTDLGLTQRWRFDQDPVVASITLFARWGSDDAVGAWFDMTDNGLAEGVSDDVENIWVFEPSGRYLQFARTHEAGTDWTSTSDGPVVDRDKFLLLEEGSYYLNGATLNRSPRRLNVVAMGLVNGAVTDTVNFGMKNEAEAAVVVQGTEWESSVADWFSPEPATVSFDTVQLAKWDDLVPRMTLGSDVRARSPLATVQSESGDDFRAPNTLADYPPEVQAVFPPDPVNPLGVTAVEIEAAWDAYQASAFFQGLTAAGTALTDDATLAFAGGASSISRNGTTGVVAWTNNETVTSQAEGFYDYSGTATYRPTADENLPGGLVLLKSSLGTSTYAGNQGGQTTNLGTWTIRFSGGEVTILEYTWNDLTKSFSGSWTINGTLTHDPNGAQ